MGTFITLSYATPSNILTTASSPVFTTELELGSQGPLVTTLQKLLASEGVFTATHPGYFGPVTRQALAKFQEKYKDEILTPQGQTTGTGIFNITTRAKVNQIIAKKSVPATTVTTTGTTPVRNLYLGFSDADVKALRQALIKQGLLTSAPTGYFGPATFKAVKSFQSSVGLIPIG